jgi:hypothetical protein
VSGCVQLVNDTATAPASALKSTLCYAVEIANLVENDSKRTRTIGTAGEGVNDRQRTVCIDLVYEAATAVVKLLASKAVK